jgi:hypothetical protein
MVSLTGGRMIARLGRGALLVLLAAILLVVAACGSSDTGERATTPEASSGASSPSLLDPEGNFVLYVSNQSFELPTIDVLVEVDGQRVVDEDLEVGNQHNWKRFVLELSPGRHTLVARSSRGDALLQRSFVVSGKRWAVLDYWYYSGANGTPEPKHFTFIIRKKPIGFA